VDDAQHRLVERSSDSAGSVTTFSGTRHAVDLAAATCTSTCGHYQINRIPCGHAVALIRKLGKHPHDFIPAFFLMTTHRDTYRANLHPVDCTELPSSVDCLQPILKKPRGRPKERRLRKAERRRRTLAVRAAEAAEVPDNAPQRCAQCGGIGHNRRTCKEIVQAPLVGDHA
jgi:hypothetical protein